MALRTPSYRCLSVQWRPRLGIHAKLQPNASFAYLLKMDYPSTYFLCTGFVGNLHNTMLLQYAPAPIAGVEELGKHCTDQAF